MAIARDIMGGGTPAGQAKAINGRVAATVSAAGTTLSDATQLDSTTNYLSTVAASTGVKLFNGEIGDTMTVYNGGANPVVVYPHSSTGTINQLSAGTGHTLATSTRADYTRVTSTKWIVSLSA